MMKSLGQDPSDEELKELISSVDENNDGQIQLREVRQAQIVENGAHISRHLQTARTT